MTDREKVFIDLNKQFLRLQYKASQYKKAGVEPPEYFLRKIKDVERKVRLISKALE